MFEDDQKRIFSKNLNRLLEINNKTQKEVADAINVLPQTLNAWCMGISLPRMGKIQALADYFKVLKSDLLDEKQNNVPESYYLNDEAKELAQFLYQNPEYRVLFDATRKVKKEDIEFVKQMMDRMRGNNYDEGC